MLNQNQDKRPSTTIAAACFLFLMGTLLRADEITVSFDISGLTIDGSKVIKYTKGEAVLYRASEGAEVGVVATSEKSDVQPGVGTLTLTFPPLPTGNYEIKTRLASVGGVSSWSAPVAFTIDPPPPLPPVATVSFIHDGLDINGVPRSLISGELRFVPKAMSATSASAAKLTVMPILGINSFDVTAALAALAPGEYDCHVRVRNSVGWSGYYGPLRVAVPIAGDQPPAPAIRSSTPTRPINGKIEVK